MTPRHFAWQAWHSETFTFVLRGRRGTWRHSPSFCVAGVALMALVALGPDWSQMTPQHFAWQAWHKETFTFVAALCVAGVALGDIHLRFAWQAWHLWHWMARLDRIICDVQCLVLYAETWRLGNACDIGVLTSHWLHE